MHDYTVWRFAGLALAVIVSTTSVRAQTVRFFDQPQRASERDGVDVVSDYAVEKTRERGSNPVTRTSQPPYTRYLRPEVFVSYGRGKFVSDYWSPAPWTNVGGGVGLRLSRRIGMEFEINRMLGVSPGVVSGMAFMPNRPGSAIAVEGREGFTSMTIASGNVLYYFSDRRIQPFLSGGIGVAWERGVVFFYPYEKEFHDAERLTTVGGGVRVAITQRIALRPEFRLYTSGVSRVSIAAAYQW